MDESDAANNHKDKSVAKVNPRFADQYHNYHGSLNKEKKKIHKSNNQNEWEQMGYKFTDQEKVSLYLYCAGEVW